MPGTTVVAVTPYKFKFKALRFPVERGTVTVGNKANLAIPDGAPLNISTAGVIVEAATSAAPNAMSLGNCVGGATDGLTTSDVVPLIVGDRIRGTLTDVIPSTWYGQVVGMLKGSGSEGWKFIISGFATGSNIFKIVDILGHAVGDANQEVEVEKTA